MNSLKSILLLSTIACSIFLNPMPLSQAGTKKETPENPLSQRYEKINAIFMPKRTEFTGKAVPARMEKTIFVDVKIEDKTCTMLLDTGASHTVFNTEFIKKNFPSKKSNSLPKEALSAVENVNLFNANSLEISGNKFYNFTAATYDLAPLKAVLPEEKKLDGVLGMNLITQRPVLIAYSSKQIQWLEEEELETKFPNKIEIPVQFDSQSGLLFFILTSPDKKTKAAALIDSGATNSYLPEKFWTQKNTQKQRAHVTSALKDAALEEFVTGKPETLYFGENFALPATEPILANDDGNGLYIIGHDILSRFDLLIHRKLNKVYILPHKQTAKTNEAPKN